MINWKEGPNHATSLCGRYSVYWWEGYGWVADCNGKAVLKESKRAAKTHCEEKAKLKLN